MAHNRQRPNRTNKALTAPGSRHGSPQDWITEPTESVVNLRTLFLPPVTRILPVDFAPQVQLIYS
jgi:hypothetical protein